MKTCYTHIFLLLLGVWSAGCSTSTIESPAPKFECCTRFDGKQLLIQDKVWDVQTGQATRDFAPEQRALKVSEAKPGNQSDFVAVSTLSPNGILALIARAKVVGPEMIGPGPVQLWDIGAGRKVVQFQPEEVYPRGAQFSPDGKRILILLDTEHNTNTLQLWDADTGRLLRAWSDLWLNGEAPPSLDGSFSPDGRRVMALSYKQITVWDSITGKQVLALKKPDLDGFYTSTQFSPDAKRILTDFIRVSPKSQQGLIAVWDAKTGQQIESMIDDLGEGRAPFALFVPDGRKIISSSSNGTAVIWDADSGKELRRLQMVGTNFETVDQIYISRDGKRVITGWDRNTSREGVTPFIALWDTDTGRLIKEWNNESWRVVGFSPKDETFMTIKDNKPDKLMDGRTGEVIREYQE
jgi:WD40 repeat protein